MGLRRFFSRLFNNPIVKAVAVTALSTFAPGILPLVTSALDGLLAAEAKFGAGGGSDKLNWVLDFISVLSPRIVRDIEAATGKELVDDALFEESIRDLVNALVKMLNAFRILPKKEGA
jgi:hypothetical protein